MFRFSLLSLGVAKPNMGLKANNFNPLTSYRERSWLAPRLRSFPSSSPSLTELPKSNTSVPQIRKLHAGFKDAESKAQEKSESYIRTNKLGEEVLSNKSLCPPGYVFLDAGNCFMTRNCRKLADKLYVVYRPGLPGKPLGICIPELVHNEVQDAWFVFEEKRKRRAKRRGDRLKRANKKSQDGKQRQWETRLLKNEGKKLEEEM